MEFIKDFLEFATKDTLPISFTSNRPYWVDHWNLGKNCEAAAFGLRSSIFISPRILNSWSQESFLAVLSHEVAHIFAHRDLLPYYPNQWRSELNTDIQGMILLDKYGLNGLDCFLQAFALLCDHQVSGFPRPVDRVKSLKTFVDSIAYVRRGLLRANISG